MEAIGFTQAKVKVAENQEEYATLPSAVTMEDVTGIDRKVPALVNCFKLNDEEVARIVKHRVLWHRTLTFGHELQPFNIFAVKDYFDEKSWNENAAEEENKYENVQKIEIKMGFWQRLWFLFKGKEYVHVKAKLKSGLSVPVIELNIKQDGKKEI